SGPAMHFAQVGFAGVEIDGPLGGMRNTTGGDEQFLIFNFMNAAALRDNIRQSALELALLSRQLETISFPVTGCMGTTGPARFASSRLAIMGHSMGAWIAPLVLSSQPAYRAAVLSGAGASYIANVMDKIKPVHVRPIAEILLDYSVIGRELDAHDPAL